MRQLCQLQEIPDGGAKGFVIDDISIFAVRNGSDYYVYENKCPHMGIELHWMEDQFLDREQQFIQCSTHGALFTMSEGVCVEGPCKNQALTDIKHVIKDNMLYALL